MKKETAFIFKLSKAQRADLRAAWPVRISKDRAAAVARFIDATECVLERYLDPDCPVLPAMTQKQSRELLDELAGYAWGMRDVLKRLPERERLEIPELLPVEFLDDFPYLRPVKAYAKQELFGLLHDLCKVVEIVVEDIRPAKLRTGPNKTRELRVLVDLVGIHRRLIGRVATSEHGIFVRFMQTLAPMAKLTFGVDSLKKACLISNLVDAWVLSLNGDKPPS